MTADDYMAWANEYWQDAEAAEYLYNKYKAKLEGHWDCFDYGNNNRKAVMYYEQMMSCRVIAQEMEKRAERIRKKENN